MDDWLEQIARRIVGRAIREAAAWAADQAEDRLLRFLRSQSPGALIHPKPRVTVTAVDGPAHTLDVLITGSIAKFGVASDMRIAARLDTEKVDSTQIPPIRVLAWPTVIGDVRFDKTNGATKAIELALRFQREGDSYGLGGTVFLSPFPRLAAYGAFGDGKFVVDLSLQLPPGPPIPLGATGLAIWGVGGSFAHHFSPRLLAEDLVTEVTAPTARDFVRWARTTQVESKWRASPAGRGATGLGLDLRLGTVDGFLFTVEPAGLSYLSPGALILGGRGRLLRQEGCTADVFLVLDIPSGSVALSAAMRVDIKVPAPLIGPPIGQVFSGTGQLDLFFSFQDPTAWSLDIGRADAPVRLRVLEDIPVLDLLFSEESEAYLQVNHHRIALGARFGIGGAFTLSRNRIKLVARLEAQLSALLARDPLIVNAMLRVAGEVGLVLWDFAFLLKSDLVAEVTFPTPTLLAFALTIKLDMPWPLPDIGTTHRLGDEIPAAPTLTSPLNAGFWKRQGAHAELGPVNGQHLPSLRQFELGLDTERKAWPDIDIVVPFSERVTDGTGGCVEGPLVPGRQSGGYDITQTITVLEIFDETRRCKVPGIRAVWEDMADAHGVSERPVLRVLGTDPFGWYTPQTASWSATTPGPTAVHLQFFGDGPDESFATPRRIGRVLVHPAGMSALSQDFMAIVGTRVLRPRGAALQFLQPDGAPLQIDRINLYVVVERSRPKLLARTNPADEVPWVSPLPGGYEMVRIRRVLHPASDMIQVSDGIDDLPIHAIGFRAAPRSFATTGQRTLLLPGRYTLRLEGTTRAVHPGSQSLFPAPAPVTWGVRQSFETVTPETARPYILHATFGDTRLFARPQPPWTQWTRDSWNPSPFGFGFPVYRGHDRVIRFLVPYADQIFPSMRGILTWSDGRQPHCHDQPLTLRPAADGHAALASPQAKDWLTAHGADIAPDLEAVLDCAIPAATRVDFTLRSVAPGGEIRDIDAWSFHASAFDGFAHHMAWDHPGCLTHRISPDGRAALPTLCPPLAAPDPAGTIRWTAPNPALKRPFDPPIGVFTPGPGAAIARDDLLAPPLPEEFAQAPAEWLLPATMAQAFGALDETAGQRFVDAAIASGARFGGPAPADPLEGLLEPPARTELVALTDSQDSVLALWLRTPEPVDWRRVSSRLTLRHVAPATGCPSAFARRHPLSCEMAILPSCDGASAFLAARVQGSLARLPRGEVELILRFDPAASGLPPLSPSPANGSEAETALYRFLQPLGAAWPLPSGPEELRLDPTQVLRPPHGIPQPIRAAPRKPQG